MDEARVVQAFRRALEAEGWKVATEVDFVSTSRPGLLVWPSQGARARCAVVVPDTALTAARKVPTWVRSRLGIDVYAVHEDDRVERYGSTALTDPDDFPLVPVEEDE
jgi:hypothetical protein